MFEVNDEDFFFDEATPEAIEEDSILPDDFNQDQQEEVTETVEDTPEAEEVTEPEQQPQTLKIKYNKEEREITLEEAVELSQKGMNYEKLQERLNTLQSDPRLSFVDELAKESNMSTQEFLDAVREQREQARLNELVQQNIPEQYAREILENRKFREEFQTKQKAQQEEQKRQAEFQEFMTAYPDVKADEIPTEVWDMHTNGKSLVDAYARYENQQLKTKLQMLQQNQTNAQRAAVGSVTAHGGQEIASKDDFELGFDSTL